MFKIFTDKAKMKIYVKCKKTNSDVWIFIDINEQKLQEIQGTD